MGRSKGASCRYEQTSMIVAVSVLWIVPSLLAGAGGHTALSSVDFAAADERTKGRTLGAIAASEIQLAIDDVIPLIRLGAVDRSPLVRQTRPRNQNASKGFQRFWKPFFCRKPGSIQAHSKR